jgi:hypothetical protein
MMEAGELKTNVTCPCAPMGTEELGIACEAIVVPTGIPEAVSKTLRVSVPAKPETPRSADTSIRVRNPLTPAVKVCPVWLSAVELEYAVTEPVDC